MGRKKKSPRITTVQQAKRIIKIIIGFTVILFGCIMLVTPGPGLVTIVLGLALLGTEFVWAKRLMTRFEKEATTVKNSFFKKLINKSKDNEK